MKPGDLLFTFGTLARGGVADLSTNSSVMFLAPDFINGSTANLGRGPTARPIFIGKPGPFDPDAPYVSGDLFRIRTWQMIAHLNAYALCPVYSERILTETETGRSVWVYAHKLEPEPLPPALQKLADKVINN